MIFKHNSFHQLINAAKERNWSVIILELVSPFLNSALASLQHTGKTVSIYRFIKNNC